MSTVQTFRAGGNFGHLLSAWLSNSALWHPRAFANISEGLPCVRGKIESQGVWGPPSSHFKQSCFAPVLFVHHPYPNEVEGGVPLLLSV